MPKPFKPLKFKSNENIIKSVSSPIQIKQQTSYDNDSESNCVFKAQLVNNFSSGSTVSLKSNNSGDDLNSPDPDVAWHSYRRASEMARSDANNPTRPKTVERSLSVSNGDRKPINQNLNNNNNKNSTQFLFDNDANKIEDVKLKRLQVKKTIQAKLAEALAKESPVIVNGLP